MRGLNQFKDWQCLGADKIDLKMKFVLLVSIIYGFLFASACPELKNSAAQSNADTNLSKTDSRAARENTSIPAASSETLREFEHKNRRTPETAIDKPDVGIFYVVLSPFRYNQKKAKKQGFGFFDNRLFSSFGWVKIKEGLEFDIVNQYGFLGKGRIVKFVKAKKGSSAYWEIAVVKNSLRDEIDKLAETRMGELEAESPSLPAIGVFPSKPERAGIRSGDKIDATAEATAARQTVYLSLPKEITDNADVYGEAGKLEYPNDWADLNGDGEIDYVNIRIRCEEKPHSHCEKNLFLHDGKWIELPEKTEKN